MNLPLKPTSTQQFLRMAGLVMPYLVIWLGLFVIKDAWSAVIGYHLGIILLVTLAGAWPPLSKFQPGASTWKVILFSLTGCLAGVAVYLLWPMIHVSPTLKVSLVEWGLNADSWLPFIVYNALINPWLEEIYWRNWLGRAGSQPILTDAVFAGFHLIILTPFISLFWLAVVFITLAFSGWMWRQVMRVEKSMLASTLFHMSADVSILIVVWSTLGSLHEA